MLLISRRSQAIVRALGKIASEIEDRDELMSLLANILEIFCQLALRGKLQDEKQQKTDERVNESLMMKCSNDRLCSL